MNKTGAPVGVLDLVFPDTTLRYGQIELERGRLGSFPDRLVATGYVVRPDGMGLYQITSGQLQLAKGLRASCRAASPPSSVPSYRPTRPPRSSPTRPDASSPGA